MPYLIALGIALVIGVFSHIPTSPSVNVTHKQSVKTAPTQAITPTNSPTPTEAPTIIPTSTPTPTVMPTPTIVSSGLSNDNYYTNSAGNEVHSPAYSNTVPAGASALCGDGTYSFSQSRRGTCSHHGGVSQWL